EPAPVTFSMIMVCPSDARMPSAMIRPSVSVGPPAGNGTIIVIGRDGKPCACAPLEPQTPAHAATNEGNFLSPPSPFCGSPPHKDPPQAKKTEPRLSGRPQ